MQDVPALGLLVIALGCLGVRLVGVDLYGEELLRVHGDHLDRRLVVEVADDLVVVTGEELVELHAGARPVCHRGADALVRRDVERLAIVDVTAVRQAPRLGDARASPDGGDVGGLEKNWSHGSS